ncbi:MAG: hypothetical protein HRF49_11990 [bacterium]|jgi:hypothetical protein
MKFEWSQYLVVAEALEAYPSSPQHREAFCRACIGRAYYAAFGVAVEHIESQLSRKLSPANKHSFVLGWFKSQPDRDCGPVAMLLGLLLVNRAKADYEKRFPDAQKTAPFCLAYARDAIAMIEAMK